METSAILDGDNFDWAAFEAVLPMAKERWQFGLGADVMSVSVSVVIPTLNEADNLRHVLPVLPEGLHEVIVVDGHSTDGTVEVARRLRPDVKIVMQDRKGKGNALACGFAACTGDIVVMIDADGSTDPAEIPRYVAALVFGADFAKGSRFLQGGGSSDITPIRKAGNWVLNALVNRLYGTRYTDLCYGFNAFWREHLPVLNVDCDGFEVETLLNIRATKGGLRISEVPSFERERIAGESKLSAPRDGVRILRTILRERAGRQASTGPSGSTIARPRPLRALAPPERELERLDA